MFWKVAYISVVNNSINCFALVYNAINTIHIYIRSIVEKKDNNIMMDLHNGMILKINEIKLDQE